jgi:hypothetical protein
MADPKSTARVARDTVQRHRVESALGRRKWPKSAPPRAQKHFTARKSSLISSISSLVFSRPNLRAGRRETVILRRAVSNETWNKIIAQLRH